VNIQTIFEGQFRVRDAYGIPETIRTSDVVISPTVAGGGNKKIEKGEIFCPNHTISITGWMVNKYCCRTNFEYSILSV
jgi:hypothetical protein